MMFSYSLTSLQAVRYIHRSACAEAAAGRTTPTVSRASYLQTTAGSVAESSSNHLNMTQSEKQKSSGVRWFSMPEGKVQTEVCIE